MTAPRDTRMDDRTRPTPLLWGALGGVALLLLALAVAAWMFDDDAEPTASTPGLSADGSVLAITEVINRRDSLLGQEVEVGGDLGRGLTPHVSLLDGRAYNTDDILLVTEQPSPGAFPIRVPVRATGEVVEFDVARMEQRLGVDLDNDLLDDYNGRVALLASDLHFFVSSPGLGTQLADLAGRRVTIAGEITAVHGERLVALEGATALVQLPQGASAEPVEGAAIQATGVARIATTDGLAGLPGVSGDQADDLGGTPIIEATEVRVVR